MHWYTKIGRLKCKEFHVSKLGPKTKLGGLNDDEHATSTSNSKPEFYFPCYGNYYRSYSNSRNPPHYIRSWEDTLRLTTSHHSFIIKYTVWNYSVVTTVQSHVWPDNDYGKALVRFSNKCLLVSQIQSNCSKLQPIIERAYSIILKIRLSKAISNLWNSS